MIKQIRSWIFDIIIVLLVVYIVTTFIGQRTSVIGSSMEPTLHNGDQIIINKISYRFSEPKRFDIVVFPYKQNQKQFYIKRIIGLPGETVKIQDGHIYIDGELLEENYGLDEIKQSGRADEEIIVEEDEYFVLGDNRNNSSDSRFVDVGNIAKKDIQGKAWLRIWPFGDFGTIQ
ncbi:MAG: signal peptidase I [Eubacteriales bacterium]